MWARAVLRARDDTEAERWAAGIERTGLRVVTAFDAEYPEPLREIADPPFLLFALGRLDRLRLPAVAIVGSRDAVLEFQVEIDGLSVNGVDMINWNEKGEIVEFKVMIRPLKAVNLIHQKMAAMLLAGK